MMFTGQPPPRRFLCLDCGSDKTDLEIMNELNLLLREEGKPLWIRFNTLNRGDAVKILDNLNNIVKTQQTSEFHKKFVGHSAIIVCPGPSLSKNIEMLKKAKGRSLLLRFCMLMAPKKGRNNTGYRNSHGPIFLKEFIF